jgi:bifunctional non-homologous end joining protein LigD
LKASGRFSAKTLEPMYASIGTDVPVDAGWSFEPKYDGMRALAFLGPTGVRLMTRNGKDKAAQFPELVLALGKLERKLKRRVILDGEVVALERNRPGSFQSLQGRFHLKSATDIAEAARSSPAAIIVFDILADEGTSFVEQPLSERRKRLERVLRSPPRGIRISESSPNGARMIARAQKGRWEGVIAKRNTSSYMPGARSRDWLKLKLQHRAEFVIGGFTEPRGTRPFLGAILLGYFDAKERLHYVGHAGGGFNREALREMRERLHRLEQDRSPFVETPRANEHAHWVKPKMVVEVKFAEWTSDHRLRQPIFLGVRNDKNAKDVRLEAESVQRFAGDADREKHKASSRTRGSLRSTSPKQARAAAKSSGKRASKTRPPSAAITQLDQIARAGGDGVLTFGSRKSLHVSSLDKVFFDESGITKGDVMRYYMRVAPVLLPLIDDRPLILKRYPNGIKGQSFFQQNAGISPAGVRVAKVTTEEGKSAQRIIGGDLLTLLYAVQLGMIAVHPWQSRLPSIEFADYSTIDLDPGEGVSFERVVELAARIRDELEALELIAALKTSGSRGLHIVLPLPPRTSYAQSAALAEAIAARVTAKHPDLATRERSIRRRPRGTIYVDAKQNARGKSVASAYSVRERAGAPVSAPLRWTDLRRTLRLDDFTIATMPRRLDSIGDLWGEVLKRRNAARTIDRALMNE